MNGIHAEILVLGLVRFARVPSRCPPGCAVGDATLCDANLISRSPSGGGGFAEERLRRMSEIKVFPPLDHFSELEYDELTRWRIKLTGWMPVRKGTGEPCWLCDGIGPYMTYQSPDLSRTQDWAYDICVVCLKKMGIDW
jgi:hypothetical protein